MYDNTWNSYELQLYLQSKHTKVMPIQSKHDITTYIKANLVVTIHTYKYI